MRKAILLMLLAVVNAGCAATNTGIVQITDNTYMYSKLDRWAQSGGIIKAELYKEANAFCMSKGKKLVPLSSTSMDRRIGGKASAEIQFSCN